TAVERQPERQAAEPVTAGRQNGSGDGSRAAVERQPERQAAEPVTAGRQNGSGDGSRAAVERQPERQAAEPVSAGRQNGSGDGSRVAVERQPERQAAEPVSAGRQPEELPEPEAAAEEVPRWVLVTAWVAVGVVAAVAATVSFEHMRELAERSGEGWRSWLLPLSADGLILAGSLVMYVRSRSGKQAGFLPWLALFGGLAVSVAANVGTALLPPPGEAVPEAVRMAVAGFSPVALIVAAELLMQLVRQSSRKERGRR